MAKKGQPVQLQTEVTTDEEWEKLLQKDGLIVVDVYSDWCGPCLGMQANLKKIKLEVGGDLLQLAVAKSDGITQLERFRNKSEPTWMFISKGKMVNLMFGADAPKLTRVILDELKTEQAIQEGQPLDRKVQDIEELSEEEQVRYDAEAAVQKLAREKEETKRANELLERRTKECQNILDNVTIFGVALVFPCAKDKYKEVINEILEEAGLVIINTEKVQMTEDILQELCYFSQVSEHFSESDLEDMLAENVESLWILFKISARSNSEFIDPDLLTMIYGESEKPPGSPESAAQRLKDLVAGVDTEEQGTRPSIKSEQESLKTVPTKTAIWAPTMPELKATALRMFFPKVVNDFIIPAPPPEPEHVTIIFDLEKREEVFEIMKKFGDEIMEYGIFSSDNIDEAQLVAKTLRKLDKLSPKERSANEKLILQVSKKRSECVFSFAELEPLYMSPNAEEGKKECEKLFPDNYFEPESEEEEEAPTDVEDTGGTTEEEGETTEGESGMGEGETTSEFEGTEEDYGDTTEEEGATTEPSLATTAREDVSELPPMPDPPTDDPVKLNEDIFEELLFFSEYKLTRKTIEDTGNNKLTFALLFKRSNENLSGNIDDVVLQMVYGNSRCVPGDEKSPACKLKKIWNESGKPKDWIDVKDNLSEEELAKIEDEVLLGIWAPPNSLCKAMVLKLLFPTISGPFKMPDLKEVPLHLAVAYDAFKAKDVFDLSEKYPDKVMSFGYFDSDIPGEAKLLAKTTDKYETRTVPVTYEEKLVIQLAKGNPTCFVDFMELGPSFISKDVEGGEQDCLYFFPPGYNAPEVEIITYLKKKSKKKGKIVKVKAETDQEQAAAVADAETTVADANVEPVDENEEEAGGDEVNNEEQDSDEEEVEGEDGDKPEEEVLESADKATSPVAEN